MAARERGVWPEPPSKGWLLSKTQCFTSVHVFEQQRRRSDRRRRCDVGEAAASDGGRPPASRGRRSSGATSVCAAVATHQVLQVSATRPTCPTTKCSTTWPTRLGALGPVVLVAYRSPASCPLAGWLDLRTRGEPPRTAALWARGHALAPHVAIPRVATSTSPGCQVAFSPPMWQAPCPAAYSPYGDRTRATLPFWLPF
eukprot:2255072-Prymnesium_polylepis.1